jgi:hypothetical protein
MIARSSRARGGKALTRWPSNDNIGPRYENRGGEINELGSVVEVGIVCFNRSAIQISRERNLEACLLKTIGQAARSAK